MSVTLSPLPPRYSVVEADDPFKKYWWLLLLGFGLVALWLLSPMIGEKSIGSESVSRAPASDAGVEQSLAGAEGGGLQLSMEGAASAKPSGASSLLQPAPDVPGGEGAAGAAPPSGAISGSTLADELKKVSQGDGGWGGEKARRGFAQPKLSGGSLSGMSAASGGTAGSASASVGAFGARNAQVSFSATKNVSDAPEKAAAGARGLEALKAAEQTSRSAALDRSNDGAMSSLNRAFDGVKARGGAITGGGDALAGTYAKLDAAPINLKLDDPKLSEKKLEAPPATKDVGASDMKDSEFAKSLAMSVAGAAIGGAIGGPAGAIVMQVVQQAIQRQEDQARKIRELEEKQQLSAAKRRSGSL